MEFDQAVRRQWRQIRARIAQWQTRAGLSAGRAADAGREAFDHPRAGIVARALLLIALVLVVLYPALAWWHSTIDDDLAFSGKVARPGSSHLVANSAALINREVHKHGWTANAPWFSPNALLDDMPNYQTGIVAALANVAHGLNDRHADQDLQSASDLLHQRPDAWLWHSSGSEYRDAAKALRGYNARLAAGQASFDHGAPALQALLDRVADDLDAQSGDIADHVDNQSGWPFDTTSDDVFYAAKGRLYAYYIVLKGAETDFAPVIASRGLQRPWFALMQSLRMGASIRPWMVMNGSPSSDLFACTLCGEGFYLVRARAQLRAIRDILQP